MEFVSYELAKKLKEKGFDYPCLFVYNKEQIINPEVVKAFGELSDDGYYELTKEGGGKSMPLSIWLEQDIWDCIEKYKIPIAEIYKKGASRTGCMFCGYGCQFPDDNRLQLVYDLYPKWYDHFMKYENNGVTYREAMRKVLAVNGLYLPDEKPKTLFD